MIKTNEIRKIIFNLFSQNLEWVKENPSISFRPDFMNGYICPLCFEVFFEKDLDITLENHLTLEDIPPKTLGGHPQALTCKKCNNESGKELDIHLLNRLLDIDSKAFLPNSKTAATYEINGFKMNGVFEFDKNGKAILNFQPKHSNPKDADSFMADLFPPKTIYNPLFLLNRELVDESRSPSFNIQPKQRLKADERRSEIALLRIAYLIAFSTLGNGFLINAGLYKVREQILNPDKSILPKPFWINYDFPKEMEGINIITLPKELRSFLIVFSLKTNSKSRRFAIVLPGPSDPGIKVYDYIEKYICTGHGSESVNFTTEHLPKFDYLNKDEYTFGGHQFWDKYTADDYKPNLKPDKEIKI
ncbi:hypothetical protein [Flavobacterium sp. ZB4R12]|uniref:hypothetical protein n=1 Tax=Flavobacterium sp. ZB4R12 TaxID=3398732 RepID=UPI003AAB3CDF